jgi:hypothetical protein
MGHTEVECPTPAPRNVLDKLPHDLRLGLPEERKKKMLGFGQATEGVLYGSYGGTRRTQGRL